ncbi:MAG: sarcosine oxidase subunit delta [Shimia sp.]
MLMLTCPNCGQAKDETEVQAGGEAHIVRAGPGADEAEVEAYLFTRTNPKGVHFERWRCAAGCGKWFHAARCTVSNEVFGTYGAQVTEPPRDVMDRIAERRPGWRAPR